LRLNVINTSLGCANRLPLLGPGWGGVSVTATRAAQPSEDLRPFKGAAQVFIGVRPILAAVTLSHPRGYAVTHRLDHVTLGAAKDGAASTTTSRRLRRRPR
jgi:hypothetical protein